MLGTPPRSFNSPAASVERVTDILCDQSENSNSCLSHESKKMNSGKQPLGSGTADSLSPTSAFCSRLDSQSRDLLQVHFKGLLRWRRPSMLSLCPQGALVGAFGVWAQVAILSPTRCVS